MEEKNMNNEDEVKDNLQSENGEKKEAPTTSLLKKKGKKDVEDITSKLERVVENKERENKGNKTPLIVGIILLIVVVGVVLFFVLGGKKNIIKTSGTGITSGGSDYVEMKIVETTKEGKKIVKTKIVKKSEIEKVKKELAKKSPNVEIKVKKLSKKEVEQKKEEIAKNIAPQPEETTKEIEGETTTKENENTPKAEETKAKEKTHEVIKPVKPTPVKSEIKPVVKKVESIKPTIKKTIKKENTLKEGALVPLDSSVIPPKLIKKTRISKPAKARFSNRGGMVILRILIDENGNVIKSKVISENPRNYGFGKAAQNGVKRFKFTPAKKNGIKVKVWKTIVIKF